MTSNYNPCMHLFLNRATSCTSVLFLFSLYIPLDLLSSVFIISTRRAPRSGLSSCWAILKYYQSKKKSQKESFPGSEFKPASIWTCWMQIDRQMQSAFMPELHRWISKLTARHLQGPPGDLLITMVKETVILYKKEFRKMKKSRITH